MSDQHTIENEPLRRLFQSHGIEAEADDGWLRLPNAMAARAVVWRHDTGQPGMTMLQLDVVVELWTGRHVLESCAGFGDSYDKALDNAFESFASSALHPMLVAFFHTDHEAVRDAMVIDGVMRAVTIGEVSVRGNPPGGESMEMGWFQVFKKKLGQAELPGGTHWIRLYFAQQNGEILAKEVVLDNEPWPWMQQSLQDAPWPSGPDFMSARLFVVLQGGVDVSRAVARMVEMPGRPDAEIGEALSRDGADPQEVQALLAFVPLAFGRVALQELEVTFSDKATVRDHAGDEGTEIRLAEDLVFAQADRLARRAIEHGTMTQDEFLAVAARSAELHAINNAMNQGAEAKDLVVSPPDIRLY